MYIIGIVEYISFGAPCAMRRREERRKWGTQFCTAEAGET
jgi:hypothetical protein